MRPLRGTGEEDELDEDPPDLFPDPGDYDDDNDDMMMSLKC